MDFDKNDKLEEINVTIDESFSPYFTDTFSPGNSKEQFEMGKQVLDLSTNPYFGDGSSGDLYIKTGETVSLSSGVYNYYNLTIESGGTLTAADTTNPFVIKVKGTTTINGTIAFNEKDLTFRSATTIPNQLGEEITVGGTGAGGDGGDSLTAGNVQGGVSANGIGGGGAGGYGDALPGAGGSGSDGPNSGGARTEYLTSQTGLSVTTAGQNGGNSRGGSGAFGANTATFSLAYSGAGGDGRGGGTTAFGTGQDGQDAQIVGLSAGTLRLGGGGGGGGGRGKNGASLILIANKLSGTGTINCSGGNGSSGGNGGAGAGNLAAYGGQGGGGGGGGSGGAILLAYEGDATGLTISNTSGTGGTGGTVGTGAAGQNGANGVSGGTSTQIVKKLSELF